MESIWMGIAPSSTATRVIAMAGPSDTILKAQLAREPKHPRALATLLEAIALWQGQPVRAALCADDRGFSLESNICREAFLDDGGALYSLVWVPADRGPPTAPRASTASVTSAISSGCSSPRWRDDPRRAAFARPAPLLRRALEGRHHRRTSSACTTTPSSTRIEPERFANRRYAATAAAPRPVQALHRARRSSNTRAARHAPLRDDPGPRLPGRRPRAPPLRAPRAARVAPRGVLPALDPARRAGPGRLGLLRQDPHRPRASGALSCFVMVLVLVARDLRALHARPDPRELPARPRRRPSSALGGVPRSLLYDNLKSVVLERVGRSHPLPPADPRARRPLPLRAASPVAVARGNEKGKVERTIRYLRDSFFAARRFASLDDLNRQLDDWIERVAHARRVPGDPTQRTVARRPRRGARAPLAAARAPLRAAISCAPSRPARRRTSASTATTTRSRTPSSASRSRSSRPTSSVRILDGDREVARHARSYDRGRQIEDEAHLAALAAEKRKRPRAPRAQPPRRRRAPRRRLPRRASRCTAVTSAAPRPACSTCSTNTAPPSSTPRSPRPCSAAPSPRTPSRTSSTSAARSRGAPIPLDVVLPDDPRVRDLVLTPHSLALYDALADAGRAAEPDDADKKEDANG